MSEPSAAAAAEATAQKNGMAVILWAVGMFCIFGWDWLINLPHEIDRIWKRKFTVSNSYFSPWPWVTLTLKLESVCLLVVSPDPLLRVGQERLQYRAIDEANHWCDHACPMSKYACLSTWDLPFSNVVPVAIFKWQPVSALISIQMSQTILGLRVYAVSHIL